MKRNKTWEENDMADELGMVDLAPAGGSVTGEPGSDLYDVWRVKIRTRNRAFGGVPKNPKIIKAWHEQKILAALKAGNKIEPKMAEEDLQRLMDTVKVDEEASWCGFKEFYKNEEVGPYYDGYNFKAMFREGATQTGAMLLRFSNNRGLRQHYQHGIHVKNGDGSADIILLGPVEGQEEFVGHVKTAQGQKAIISRYDFIGSGVELEFQIWSLAVGILDTSLVKTVLTACQEIGIGASRSREMSKFDLVELERIQIGNVPHFEKMKAEKSAKAAKAAEKKGSKAA